MLRCGLHLVVVLGFLAGVGLVPPLPAQGGWSPSYDTPGFGVGGRVFGLGTWRNELIACTYQTPWRDGSRLQHIGRFDGVRWTAMGTGVPGYLRTALEYQGELYVGGQNGVRRWDGSQFQIVGAGLSGEVWALVEHQGELYAAGSFNVSGTQTARSLARWNGSLWLEVGGGLRRTGFASTTARTLHSDGALLYVGGEFDQAGPTTVGRIAAWNGTSWLTLGGGVGGFVSAIATHNGRLYCGGSYDHAGPVAADGIAAWDGTQWLPVGAGVQALTYGAWVHSLCVWNNELHVGGHFNGSGSTLLHNIARFDGSQLLPVSGGVGYAEVNPPTVYAMTTWNGMLCCGGEFKEAGDLLVPDATIAANHIAAYDGTRWRTVGEGLGFDGRVTVLGRYEGQVVAGGSFAAAGSARAHSLARFDGDDWRWFGSFLNGAVLGMVEHNGELWVAGQFDSVDGIQVDGVARFDGTQWHAVGGGPGPLRANCIAVYQGMVHIGSTGSPKRWTGTSWQTFAPTISGTLNAMHVHQGLLYIGGATASAPRLHAWDGTNASVPGGGVNDSVEGLGSFGTDLIVGGRFTTAGGQPARTIARWTGSAWVPLGTGVPGSTAKAITTFRGTLVVGGAFDTFQGAPANSLVRWTGSSWAALATVDPSGAVYTLLADDARGELLAGGLFAQNGTADAGNVAAFESVPYWTEVGQALASPRRAPHLAGDGRLLPGSHLRWRLSSAQEAGYGVLIMGFTRVDLPAFGGTLVPSIDATATFTTDGIGTVSLSVPWLGLPAGLEVWFQAGTVDPTGPQGLTASNAVWLRCP